MYLCGVQELKQQNALLSETKVLLQDEVSELHSRLERLSKKFATLTRTYMFTYCIYTSYATP